MVRGVDDVDAMKTGDVTQSGEVTAAAVVVDERRRAADTAALTVTAASDTDTVDHTTSGKSGHKATDVNTFSPLQAIHHSATVRIIWILFLSVKYV